MWSHAFPQEENIKRSVGGGAKKRRKFLCIDLTMGKKDRLEKKAAHAADVAAKSKADAEAREAAEWEKGASQLLIIITRSTFITFIITNLFRRPW